MSRTLSLSLSNYLNGSLLALTNCVKVVRLDGQQFGFCSLDQDIEFDGLAYEAGTSADISELRTEVGQGVDNADLVSLISSDRITEADLLGGIWDGARIEMFMLPFEDTSMGRIGPLISGVLGELQHERGQWRAEIRSLSQRLSQQFVELTSPTCRVRRLFDARCMPRGFNEGTDNGTLAPTDFRFDGAVVTAVTDARTITLGGPTTPTGGESQATDYYRYGIVKMTSGPNAGIEREIKSHVGNAGTGRGALFSGSNYLSRADNASLSVGNQDFTLWAWVYLAAKGGGDRGVIGKLTSANDTKWGIRWNAGVDRWQFTVWLNSGTAADVNADAYGSPPLNTWAFVIAWHDATANTINIQADNGTVNSTGYGSGTQDEGLDFVIGNMASLDRPFSGRIDEAGFAKRVLTAGEREDLYEGMVYAGYSTAMKVDLISQWPLDELSTGAAPVTREDAHGANDLTDNGNVASVTGAGGEAQAVLTLQEAFPFAVSVGQTAFLEAGCDRTKAMCQTKFKNLWNLQAEPDLPGNQSLIKTGRG